ncbi:YjcZ family sporulation protein [Bacillus marasmi]|uniref:YjcZ family sporulation protein n=1 Tax=Bacillus marasmi TaxID=1926279 RepID=UPI0024830EBD|nr:YjcZ family sporulation protein [Bacillus marasmi]
MHFGHGGFGCGVTAPMYTSCGYGYGYGYGNWFALIVVLFILLIIIGASCYGK